MHFALKKIIIIGTHVDNWARQIVIERNVGDCNNIMVIIITIYEYCFDGSARMELPVCGRNAELKKKMILRVG